jgi:hypothetical protein
MRFIYELLWCLNVSTVVVRVGDDSGASTLLGLLYRIVFPVLRCFKPDMNLRRDHSLAFWAMSLLLAVVIFALLRLLNHFSSLRGFLFPALAVIAVGALPSSFWLGGGVWVLPHNTWEGLLLLLEAIAAAACVSFYILGVRRWPRYLGPTLLILHFGIWAYACRFSVGLVDVLHCCGFIVTFFWWAPLNLIVPLLGLFSTAAWARYARVTIRERANFPAGSAVRHFS